MILYLFEPSFTILGQILLNLYKFQMVSVILGHTVLLVFFVLCHLIEKKRNNQICFKEDSVFKNEKK